MKICIACGMPMRKESDFAMGDTNKDYCIYCMGVNGVMQSYEEKLIGTTDFIVQSQGLDRGVAKTIAKDMLKRLPAWKDKDQEDESNEL